MTNEEFRERLTALGFNQSSFARRLNELGDPRPFVTVLRSISGYASSTRVPGELVVVLNLMAQVPEACGEDARRLRGRPRKAVSSTP